MALGLDGCRGGWVAVSLDSLGSASARLVASFREALAVARRGSVAVDMPIGLLDKPAPGGRECDRLARRLLGARAASVFSPPSREALAARDFTSARGVSLQAWSLAPKVREVDAAMTPARQRRVVEAHPELAFAALGRGPCAHPKRTPEGRAERLARLRRAEGRPFADLLSHARLTMREGAILARPDDVLDACALALVARRHEAGLARRLPDEPPRDARGLRMEIWA